MFHVIYRHRMEMVLAFPQGSARLVLGPETTVSQFIPSVCVSMYK